MNIHGEVSHAAITLELVGHQLLFPIENYKGILSPICIKLSLKLFTNN